MPNRVIQLATSLHSIVQMGQCMCFYMGIDVEAFCNY